MSKFSSSSWPEYFKVNYSSCLERSNCVLMLIQLLQVAINSLWFDSNLGKATDTARVHHQLIPNEVSAELWLDQVWTNLLYVVIKKQSLVPNWLSLFDYKITVFNLLFSHQSFQSIKYSFIASSYWHGTMKELKRPSFVYFNPFRSNL